MRSYNTLLVTFNVPNFNTGVIQTLTKAKVQTYMIQTITYATNNVKLKAT